LGKSHYQNFEPPFEIPDSWEWVRLDDIAYVAAGSTPEKSAFESTDVPYIKMYNLRNQAIDFEFKPQYIKREVHEGRLKRSMAYSGDLIMNIVGPPLGKLAIIPNCLNECNFNQAAVVIRPYLQKVIINPYLFNYLSEMSEIRSISTKGSAGQDNISLTQSQNMRIALPPLSEQKRIVSSISTWFNIINTIDNSTNRIISNISSLKSKLLDLAISGKLVPQESTDEPAIEALRRINPSFQPCDNPQYENMPFKIPESWSWCLFSDIAQSNIGLTYKPTDIVSTGGTPVYRSNNIQNKCIDTSDIVRVNTEIRENQFLNVGDLLICARNGSRNLVGKCALINELDEPTSFGAFMAVSRSLYNTWIFQVLNSDYFDRYLDESNSTAINQVTQKMLLALQIPFPPIAEQQRIVDKVNELFTILDSIQNSLDAN
jgi:type I restriction enzyme S subunit